MKKLSRRLIAVVLALTLILGAVAISGAANVAEHNPVIILPGINHSLAYLADENGNPALDADGNVIEGNNLIIDTTSLIPYALKRGLLPLLATLGLQADVGWTSAAHDIAKQAFSIQAGDDEGNTINDIRVYRYGSMATVSADKYDWFCRMVPIQDLVAEVGKDHVYFFTFNLAGDPMESAKELDRYIQQVKAETGSEQVDLLSVSLGGTLFTAYIEQFKEKGDIGKAVNAVAVLNGTNIVDDFYTRSWNLDDKFLYSEFFPIVMGESGDEAMGYLINILLRIFPKQVLYDTLTAAYDELYNNMLTKIPQFWAMCSKETYAQVIDNTLPKSKYPVLRAKTDAFQQARLNCADNMRYMVEHGCEINNLCGYNLRTGDVQYAFFKIAASAEKVNSDSIINIESTALGCKAALPGEKLTGVTAGAKYISPDGSIDASTCALPDNTWFFRDMHHEDAGNNAATMNLVKELLCGNTIKNISSDPTRYPQFNFGTNNKKLRRWYLPDAKAALGSMTLSAEDKAELEAAIADGNKVLAQTIGNADECIAASQRLFDILVKIGYSDYTAPEEKSETGLKVAKGISDFMFKTIGGRGFSDVYKDPFRRLLGKK